MKNPFRKLEHNPDQLAVDEEMIGHLPPHVQDQLHEAFRKIHKAQSDYQTSTILHSRVPLDPATIHLIEQTGCAVADPERPSSGGYNYLVVWIWK